MGMILRIASSRIVGQGDIVGRSGYFSLNLSANSVMRGRLDARRTLKSLVADLRSFDNQFLRAWFLQNGDKYFGSYFWSNSIDVMVLATPYLASQRSQMENFKQGTVAKALGIEIDESRLHDALYDIQVCKSIYDIVSPYKM